MAWSRSFTSSASSILEVKDGQTLKAVPSYHKSRGHTLSQSPAQETHHFQESEITRV
ncbi:4930455H04Rik [Phodopus roborovskii]|uniref:4930455H04Rik protein n=1 Tax=Phodopus roborovskii TaxID=109678 RepID=A0AAU9ZAR2_PHORO|nr:4930455H04Rik [Phodopus roborovskii]